MTNYFNDDPLEGPSWAAARQLWRDADVRARRREGRPDLRRVQPARPALARGLRVLRPRRGRRVHRRRRARVARRPAADEHRGRRHVRGVRARLQPGARRRAPDAAAPRPARSTEPTRASSPAARASRRARCCCGTERVETGFVLPDLDGEDTAGSGPGCAAASCSCRPATSCGRWRFPPRPMCPYCRSLDVALGAPTSGAGDDLVLRRPPPAAAPRLRRARAVQRDRRRARRGPDDPHGRQPGRPAPTARSTRSTPRRSGSASPSGWPSPRSRTSPSPAGSRARDSNEPGPARGPGPVTTGDAGRGETRRRGRVSAVSVRTVRRPDAPSTARLRCRAGWPGCAPSGAGRDPGHGPLPLSVRPGGHRPLLCCSCLCSSDPKVECLDSESIHS